jgi:hypothetical protein
MDASAAYDSSMGSKDIIAAVAFVVAPTAVINSIGNSIHCEIHAGQCLHNAPDQKHIEPGDIGTVTLQLPTAINVTITPNTGAMEFVGGSASAGVGDLQGLRFPNDKVDLS